jgi:hypothetical protein
MGNTNFYKKQDQVNLRLQQIAIMKKDKKIRELEERIRQLELVIEYLKKK